MWAGGRFTFGVPLRLGEHVRKTSTIKQVVEKQGRSGKLCFVTVLHEIRQGEELALSEEHDIVYRDDPNPNAPAPTAAMAPANAAFSTEIVPDPVLLFRYSALTFNGHRIHYDAVYATNVEGYEGLVFHGPLTATLLIDHASRMRGMPPRSFSFRGTSPIAGTLPFRIEGRNDADTTLLWARRHDGVQGMEAKATF
jgi:3-methylfumaryl-CoA hydratase